MNEEIVLAEINSQSGHTLGSFTSPVLWMRICGRDRVQINNSTTSDQRFRGRNLFQFNL